MVEIKNTSVSDVVDFFCFPCVIFVKLVLWLLKRIHKEELFQIEEKEIEKQHRVTWLCITFEYIDRIQNETSKRWRFVYAKLLQYLISCHRKYSQSECRKAVAYSASVFHRNFPSISALVTWESDLINAKHVTQLKEQVALICKKKKHKDSNLCPH